MSLPAAMRSLALTVGAQAPTPPPTPEEFTIYNVTPGISGFIAFFVLALVGWLLFRSLVRHIRKVDMAGAQREREAAETGAAHEQEVAGEPDDTAAAGDDRRGQATE